jgi:hypothetical protein
MKKGSPANSFTKKKKNFSSESSDIAAQHKKKKINNFKFSTQPTILRGARWLRLKSKKIIF